MIRRVGLCLAFWLLCFGCQPAPPHPDGTATPSASGPRLFRDVAEATGLNFRWGHSSLTGLNILETIGHGCAFLDYDNDGWLDILLVGNDGPRLFRNTGGKASPSQTPAFEDVTVSAFPALAPPHGTRFLGCAVADFDNDGWPDIFLTGYGITRLLRNLGNRGSETGDRQNLSRAPAFQDVTAGSGLEARGPSDWTTSAAWADVDNDGRLDLYVCRYVEFGPKSRQLCPFVSLDGSRLEMACGPDVYPPQRGSLYRNEGGGRFRDITREAGMDTAHGFGLGCLFSDFNGDGWQDLYVANDLAPGDLFLNLGRGRFRNIGAESGTAYGANGGTISGMGLDWGDYDRDGRFDLLLANFAAQPKSLFRNLGNNLFREMSYASGLGAASLLPLAFGAVFVDYDNDGWLDIVFTNGHVFSEIEKSATNQTYRQASQLFRNLGDGRFTEISAEAGSDFQRKIVGRGIALGDYDRDGYTDLLIVDDEGAPLLLHNATAERNPEMANRASTATPNTQRWLVLRCQKGPGQGDAVGAQVTVTAGEQRWVAEVRAGGSYLSTNAPELHFGLGQAQKADSIRVRWPDGRKTEYRDVAVDRAYLATPASSALTPLG